MFLMLSVTGNAWSGEDMVGPGVWCLATVVVGYSVSGIWCVATVVVGYGGSGRVVCGSSGGGVWCVPCQGGGRHPWPYSDPGSSAMEDICMLKSPAYHMKGQVVDEWRKYWKANYSMLAAGTVNPSYRASGKRRDL